MKTFDGFLSFKGAQEQLAFISNKVKDMEIEELESTPMSRLMMLNMRLNSIESLVELLKRYLYQEE